MTALNSSSLYSLSEVDGGYGFTTDYGNEYLVTFSDLTSIIGLDNIKIYDFGIEIAKRVSAKNDNTNGKLKNTVVELLSRLFNKQPECGILIILDSSDRKHRARFRMFLSAKHNSWFYEFSTGEVEIVNIPLNIEDLEETCFLLIRRDNPYLETIQTAVAEYIDVSFGGAVL